MNWYMWRRPEPMAARRARAQREMEKLRRKGLNVQPVRIEGRKIARMFWGQAWCLHLESFSDFENRLPRGRSYVRNGLVCHLEIARGEVHAKVGGHGLYTVKVTVKTLPRKKWTLLRQRCLGRIDSLLELLSGRLSDSVMRVVTDRREGMFPLHGEIRLACSCPDWAVMCKHVAAVLYGVGARLDEKPELLFLLRGVDHEELIAAEVGVAAATGRAKSGRKLIATKALEEVFGIEMTEDAAPRAATLMPSRKRVGPGSRRIGRKAGRRAAKGKANGGRQRIKIVKPPGSAKPPATQTSKSTRDAHAVTGQAVAALRAKLDLSRSRFARLLDVSLATVGNWENARGKLRLQKRTFDAFNAARLMTKRGAWRKLDR